MRFYSEEGPFTSADDDQSRNISVNNTPPTQPFMDQFGTTTVYQNLCRSDPATHEYPPNVQLDPGSHAEEPWFSPQAADASSTMDDSSFGMVNNYFNISAPSPFYARQDPLPSMTFPHSLPFRDETSPTEHIATQTPSTIWPLLSFTATDTPSSSEDLTSSPLQYTPSPSDYSSLTDSNESLSTRQPLEFIIETPHPASSSQHASSRPQRKSQGHSTTTEPYPSKRTRAKIGAVCVRCKLFREKCSGGFPCETCQTLPLWTNICVRAKFSDLCVHGRDLFAHRFPTQFQNILYWEETPAVEIHLGTGLTPILPLSLNKYVPKDKSLLDHVIWRMDPDQPKVRIPSPPWGFRTHGPRDAQLTVFLDAAIPELIAHERFQKKDDLWKTTFQLVHSRSRLSEPASELLQDALRIWAAQQFWFFNSWRVVKGNDVIGATWAESAKLFLPPRFLYIQLDYCMDHYLKRLERSFLGRLEKHVFQRSRKVSFSLFLAAFVFLAAIEGDSWRMEKWKATLAKTAVARPEDKQYFPVWPRRESPSVCRDENNHSAAVITAHIRSCCRGMLPFSVNGLGEIEINVDNVDPEIVEYLKRIEDDLRELDTRLMMRHSSLFDEADPDSMDYTHVRGLFTEMDKDPTHNI